MWTGTPNREWKYAELAKVWEYSAHKVFGDSAEIVCRNAGRLDMSDKVPIFSRGDRRIGPSKTLAWREKIRRWDEIVQSVPVGRPILLTDIDVAFYNNPFPNVLSECGGDWDVGFCAQSTGAVYFSGSKESHDFMSLWLGETEKLSKNAKRYEELDKKHKGLDQASIQIAIARNSNATIEQLPLKYHSTIHNYDELPAYLMHYHSLMRGVIFGLRDIKDLPSPMRKYAKAWLRMQKRANSQ
jgi:hypothetical protein